MQESFAASEASNSAKVVAAAGFCIIESYTIIEAARVGIEEDLTSFVERPVLFCSQMCVEEDWAV